MGVFKKKPDLGAPASSRRSIPAVSLVMLGLGLVLHFSAWHLIWNLVILPNANSKPGMQVTVFENRSKDRPAASYIAQQTAITTGLQNSRAEAVAIWHIPSDGTRLLSLECDDYGSLLIDNRPVIAQRPATRDRNLSRALADLDRGPHLICLVLHNNVGKGRLKLSIGDGPQATPVDASQMRQIDLGNLRNWLKTAGLAKTIGCYLIGFSLLLLFAHYWLMNWRESAPFPKASPAGEATKAGSAWLPGLSFLAAAALAVYGSIFTFMPYQPYHSIAASLMSWGLVLFAGVWALAQNISFSHRQVMLMALAVVAAAAWRYSHLISIGWLHGIIDGDLIYYHRESLKITNSLGGLGDYPLLANLFVGLPGIFELDNYRTYVTPLAIIGGGLGLMGALLLLKMAPDNRAASIVALFYVITPFNANWMLNRLDAAMVLVVLLAVYFFQRGKPQIATLLVAAGFWFKGAPLILYPFFIAAWLLEDGWRTAMRSMILLLALLALPFFVFDSSFIVEPFRFQDQRRVTCASIYCIFHHLLNPSDILESPYNAIRDVAPWFNGLARAALPAALIGLFAYFAWGLKKWRRQRTGRRLVVVFALLSLELFIMANKIYSPQFVLWTFAACLLAWCLISAGPKPPGWLLLGLLTLISATNMLPYYGGPFVDHYFVISLVFWMASALLFLLLLPRISQGVKEFSASRFKAALLQASSAALLLGASHLAAGMLPAACLAALVWTWGVWVSTRNPAKAVLPLITLGSFIIATGLWTLAAGVSWEGIATAHFTGPVQLAAATALFAAAATLCAPFRPRWPDLLAMEKPARQALEPARI